MTQVFIDLADLHAIEEARETAGDLYRHAPLHYENTREGQRERDRKKARVVVFDIGEEPT